MEAMWGDLHEFQGAHQIYSQDAGRPYSSVGRRLHCMALSEWHPSFTIYIHSVAHQDTSHLVGAA